ncbi:MAG: glycosyltransferase, partial [Thermoleophilaceae bacterium]|nr:glycosyltransferase [Thermoleophilaceae bacterium]
FSTRASLRWSARNAVGFDALTPTLAKHVESRLGRDCVTILPVAAPTGVPGSIDPAVRAELPGEPFALYTGHVHPAREDDFRIGLEAVAEVRRRGHPLSFVHAGGLSARREPAQMVADAGLEPDHVRFLGYLPFAGVPALLRAAAVLVQPDRGSELNRLCLPSKLQAYLASGTPTVTFAVGSGKLLEDRVEVLKTHSPGPAELADRVEEVLASPDLEATLREGGPAAARRLFDTERNTRAMIEHYRTVAEPGTSAQ